MQTMKFLAVLFFSCVLVGVVTAAPTDTEVEVKDTDNEVVERNTRQAGGCDCRLSVYDKENLYGRSLLILQQNADFSNDMFNDRVESARISGSCSWILYQDKNFNRETFATGSLHIVRPGRYNTPISWGGPGNYITSARALPPDGTIAISLFQHSNFEGRMTVLYGSANHFPALDFDDQVGSVIVTRGTWKLYERSNYQGHYTQFSTGQYPNLQTARIGNDELSSVQLV